jgi:hypothetical protein
MKRLLPLLIILLVLNQCGGASGTSSSASDEVKEEAISNMELAANSIVDDCDETISAWAEVADYPHLTYRFLFMSPIINPIDTERLESAQATLKPKVEECYSDSVASAGLSGETLSAVKSHSVREQCEENCPISVFSCAMFWTACLGGDNVSCCWSAICTPNNRDHCISQCEALALCRDVPYNPPPPEPNGD